MYKVFVYNKAVILTEHKVNPDLEPSASFASFSSSDQLKKTVRDFGADPSYQVLYIYHHDEEALWRAFCEGYVHVEAAGGVVRGDQGNILFIFRNHLWDLPKGKMEEGESPEEAALREVKEECGIRLEERTAYIGDTYHTYERDGQDHLKRTYWFRMWASEDQELTPETKEGITRVEWIASGDLQKVITATYSSILNIIEKEVGETGSP